jgi:hypothetical protein
LLALGQKIEAVEGIVSRMAKKLKVQKEDRQRCPLGYAI